MEETYGSKFDSQLNSDLNASATKGQKLGGASSKMAQVKEFVQDNVSGLQDKIGNLDLKVDLKKILTIVTVAGVIGGVAYFRRAKRGRVKNLATRLGGAKAGAAKHKVEKVLTAAQRAASKKKNAIKVATGIHA